MKLHDCKSEPSQNIFDSLDGISGNFLEECLSQRQKSLKILQLGLNM